MAAGFALRAGLGVVEAVAYGAQLTRMPWLQEPTGIFLAAHSSFDTGAEWVIALGCVLILYRTIQSDLITANVDLL